MAKKVGKVLLRIFVSLVCVIVLIAVTILGLRWYNGSKYTIMQRALSVRETQYETNDSIRAIKGTYLKGFHFIPKERTHPGTVVVYGGSEGSPGYEQAKAISEQGYEVLGLYFWGQEDQTPTLANVPLDQFEEVQTYIRDNVDRPTPITVIGTSKGAEFSAELAAHGFAIDNLVNFTPADHSYAGLDYTSQNEFPSFTYRGQAVPFVSLRKADPSASAKLMWDLATNYPPSFRASYESAAANADDDTKIDLSGFRGNALFFAGDQDAMWQGDSSAKNLASQSDSFEAHIYSGAGHAFSDHLPEYGSGWEIMLGGTAEAGAKAHADSMRILLDRLSQWHGQI